MLTVVAFNLFLEIMQNQSFVTEFVLQGLSQNPNCSENSTVSVVFLFGYIVTVGGNLLIAPGLPHVHVLSCPSLLHCHHPKDDCGLSL